MNAVTGRNKTLLVIRMSSLGDVILSTAFLENLPEGTVVDWVIGSEFAFVLKDHPRIRRLIEFNKKTGLKGWIALLKEIKKEKYDAYVDLHVAIRSKIAHLYLGITQGFSTPWFAISKERIRFLSYVTLKEFCPQWLRPTPFWKRFARLALKVSENTHQEDLNPPCYYSVVEARQGETQAILEKYQLHSKKYYALMPASRWRSKEWSPQKYVELACTLHSTTEATILLMGRESDLACQIVKNELEARKIPLICALNEPDFIVTALLLQQAIAYVGGDTGLAHLAEAIGTPSVVLFGPTRPELGFGPWSRQSVAVHSNVWCAPCSKDGKICYRYTNRFACLKKIEVERVRVAVPK